MCRGKKAHIPASIRARTWMAYRAIQVQTADEEGSHPRRLTSKKAHIPASIHPHSHASAARTGVKQPGQRGTHGGKGSVGTMAVSCGAQAAADRRPSWKEATRGRQERRGQKKKKGGGQLRTPAYVWIYM